MGVTHGHHEITPEQEREIEAREECGRRGIDPDEICADGGVTAWMVVDQEYRPLTIRDNEMIDQAWETHKAASPVATVINDNQPGRTAIIEISKEPSTLAVGTKLYEAPQMASSARDDGDALDAIFWKEKYRQAAAVTPAKIAAVLAELMDRRLLNDVDDDLHQEIAAAIVKAVTS